VRPKDALEPTKQDGVVYKIPCECGKVYIGETGRAMQERIENANDDGRITDKGFVSVKINLFGYVMAFRYGQNLQVTR